MTHLHSALSWLRASFVGEDPLTRRMEVIRVQGLDRPVPTVSVFAARRTQRVLG